MSLNTGINPGDMANEIMKLIKKEMGKLGHANIIVAGKTGVGKSTLINAVFRERLAETGIGAPITKTLKEYTKKDFPLRVYDTIGLELGIDRQKQVSDDINGLIQRALRSGDPDQFIHCIWYCVNVNANRLEPQEEAFINQLAIDNTHPDGSHANVPVIIVLTLAHNLSHSKKMKAYIEGRNLHAKGVCAVLAEDYTDEDFCRKAYGGDTLIEYTHALIPEAAQTAFTNAQIASFKIKRNKAQLIIGTSIAASFGEGFTPIPFSDAALIVPTQLGMLAAITAVYGLNLDKSAMAAILSAIMGVSGTTVLGKTVAANLLKLIPGIGTMAGGAISGATAAALTAALGETYILVMEKVLKGEIKEQDLASGKLSHQIKSIFKQVRPRFKRPFSAN